MSNQSPSVIQIPAETPEQIMSCLMKSGTVVAPMSNEAPYCQLNPGPPPVIRLPHQPAPPRSR